MTPHFDPRTDKPLMRWERIALEVHVDKAACKRIYEAGVDLIVQELNKPAIAKAAALVRWSI